jgi:phosphinothricin acetyltransferase
MNSYDYTELTEDQLPEIVAIYNYYVQYSTATFHGHPLTPEEMRELVFFDNPKYKAFAITNSNELHGYLIITQHKKREAYDGTAEVTIYLKPDSVGKGIGSPTLKFAEEYAKKFDIHVLLAVISGNNCMSIKLFERNGYSKCAHYREVGRKFGQLLDLVAYQKILS